MDLAVNKTYQASWVTLLGEHCVAYFTSSTEAENFVKSGRLLDAQVKPVAIMNDLLVVVESDVVSSKFLWPCGCDECQQ